MRACRIRGRGRTIASPALAVAALAMSAACAQAAAWLPAQNLFSAPVTAVEKDPFFNRKALDVASDAAGDSVAVWVEQRPKMPGPGAECQAMWAARPAGGSFGAPQSLGPVLPFCGAGQIKVAMNASGTAVAAWKQGEHTDAAIRPPGGAFQSATQLDASSANDDPWVSIDAAGEAVVTWDDTDGAACPGPPTWAFHASIRQPGQGFGPFETVCDPARTPGPVIFTPRTAIDSQGDIVATWVNQWGDGTNNHTSVESAYRPAGGSFNGATPQILRDMLNVPNSAATFAADVAFDAQGRATAVWPYYDGSKVAIETAVRPAGSTATFGSPGPVSNPLAAGDSNSPRLAVDPATNTAVAAWVQCPSSSCQVEAASRPSGGGFGAPQALSSPGATTTFGPLVAFDPAGSATVTWSGPSPDITGTQVQVATRPPGAGQSFGAVTTISSADPSQSPALAFDGAGNAIAVWEHDTTAPAGQILQYAGFDASPPEIQSVVAPNGYAGQPLQFSASALDRWSPAALTWSFGDGTSVSGGSVTHTYGAHGTYHVTITAEDLAGNTSSVAATVEIGCAPVAMAAVVAAGTQSDAGCSAPGPLVVPLRPSIARLTQSHAVWREGRGRATLARAAKARPPVGTTFSFSLNTAASVKLLFAQAARGRRVAGRCVARTKRNAGRHACRRTETAGTLTFTGAHAGTNKVSFQGVLAYAKRLRPGRYTLRAVASNAGGHDTSGGLAFTIVRR